MPKQGKQTETRFVNSEQQNLLRKGIEQSPFILKDNIPQGVMGRNETIASSGK